MQAVDQHITLALNVYGGKLESYFKCDVVAFTGSIYPGVLTRFREVLEELPNCRRADDHDTTKLVIVLTTPGGVVETVEKMVEMTRHHYADVSFVVPDMAMSAGTVWCMSGDRIWMDYASSLGPIDPQVQTQKGGFVPALGYLDKVDQLIRKSTGAGLSTAEAILLNSIDLAELHRFEQARDLSITLLKEWLVAYKFKNWTNHRTNNVGAVVTDAERQERAEQIARALSDDKRWHSHGRMISMKTLTEGLRLEIDDYSQIIELSHGAKMYNALLSEFLERQGTPFLIHSPRC